MTRCTARAIAATPKPAEIHPTAIAPRFACLLFAALLLVIHAVTSAAAANRHEPLFDNVPHRVPLQAAPRSGPVHAFLWRDGTMLDLGTLGGFSSDARAVNERGQVVGLSQTALDGPSVAFLWDDGRMTPLPCLGCAESRANAINAHGEAVGFARSANGLRRAILWSRGQMIELGTLDAGWSEALDINDRGQVVGIGGVVTPSPDIDLVMWEKGRTIDLGGIAFEGPFKINNRGEILAWEYDPSVNRPRSFILRKGNREYLPTPGGRDLYATDFNDAGDVVGVADFSEDGEQEYHGFLWKNGAMEDLGLLDSGAVPVSVNNNGDVLFGSWGSDWEDDPCTDSDLESRLVRNGVITPLTTLGGTGTFAEAMAGNGLVVGASETGLPVFPQDPAAHVWSSGFISEGPSVDRGDAIAADAFGNSYVAGVFRGRIDFGGGPLISSDFSGFLVKFDPAGNHLWSTSVVHPGLGSDLALDSEGNVVVAMGLVFLKLNPSSVHLWTRSVTATSGEVAGLGVDANDEILVVGAFRGTLRAGSMTLISNGDRDVFVMKLGANGLPLWAKSFGGAGADVPRSIAVDADGNVVLLGQYTGEVDFGGGPLPDRGLGSFVVKLDGSGDHVWSQDISYVGYSKLTTDEDGNIYIAIQSGNPDFGGVAAHAQIVKLNPEGRLQWTRRSRCLQSAEALDVTVGPSGHAFLVGRAGSVVDLGGAPLTADDGAIFIAEFDGDGNHVWSGLTGSSYQAFVSAIAADASGRLLLTGNYSDSYDFGGDPLPEAYYDVFVASLALPGSESTVRTVRDRAWELEQASMDAGRLADASPNPVTVATTIRFRVPQDGPVDLAIYDLAGRRLRTLIRGDLRSGDHAVQWHGRDDSGVHLPAGLYFYRLRSNGEVITRSLTLLR